ncbi:MAG: bifunctional precorrin-2 dehydrogenase/sirohydrochlorin ferrochelatase [Actinobacteria bacterium]|nr:MAG: bifunctional precorrin-2 dehydrogenase/sirohydrochlorin ferrochelatase [Actinomycetota bacterium]
MHYPIFLDLKRCRCVVIGGGVVAERKVTALLERGAKLTVISPQLTDGLAELAAGGAIEHLKRGYQSGDLEGARLVFGATDERPTNVAVYEEAQTRGIPVNVVDDPELCSFIVPSIVARGDLQIAISTGGAAPALSKRLRLRLEREYGPEYETLVDLLAAFRHVVLEAVPSPSRRRAIFESVADSDLVDRIRAGEEITVDDLLREFAAGG